MSAIDLRSDAVTQPSPEMRRAMAEAEVGDDALFFPSGTQANCPAVRPSTPETNIVMLDLVADGVAAETVVPRLAQAGVHLVPFGPRRLRGVTHLDVSRRDVERAAEIIIRVLR